MQRRSRRETLGLILGGSSAFLLAACAPGLTPTGPTPQTYSREAGRPGPGAATSVPAPGQLQQPPSTPSPVALEIWHTEPNLGTRNAIDAIIARFQRRNSNVTVTQTSATAWAEMEKKIVGGIASGDLPDLLQTTPYFTPSLRARGLLVPVDDVVASIGKDNIFPHLRDTGALLDGRWWGIAHAWGANHYLYRADLADDQRLREPRGWVELLAFVRALQDGQPGLSGLQLAGSPSFALNEALFMFVAQDGGQLWTDDGRPNFASREVVASLQLFKDLLPSLPKGWLGQGWLEANVNLAKGTTAMIAGYGRSISVLRDASSADQVTPERYRVMKYKPVGADNSESDPSRGMRTQLDGEHWVVSRRSKSSQWVIEFLKFFYERQNYLEYCNSAPLQLLPIDLRLFNDRLFLRDPLRQQWKQQLEVQYDYLERKLAWPLLMLKEADAGVSYIADVVNSGILADMVYDVVDRNLAPQAAADKAQKRIELLVKDVK